VAKFDKEVGGGAARNLSGIAQKKPQWMNQEGGRDEVESNYIGGTLIENGAKRTSGCARKLVKK